MELWDIYDENKQPTGRTMKRNDWHMKPGEFHLTVLGVIARPDGTFLVTKRVMTKAWAPGWWEVSGGAAHAGESSWEAVRREVREETGLDVSKADGGYLFTYRRINPDERDNYFVDVYRFVMDIKDEDLAVTDMTGVECLLCSCDYCINWDAADNYFNLNFWKKSSIKLNTTVLFTGTLLNAAAHYLSNGHSSYTYVI